MLSPNCSILNKSENNIVFRLVSAVFFINWMRFFTEISKTDHMKALVLTGIRKIETIDKPVPKLRNENDVLIKIKSVGVCGSDIHYYTTGKIGSQVVQFPFAIGHECSGIIEETGKAVTRLKCGDLVTIDPSIHCGVCDQCLAGRPHTCPQ